MFAAFASNLSSFPGSLVLPRVIPAMAPKTSKAASNKRKLVPVKEFIPVDEIGKDACEKPIKRDRVEAAGTSDDIAASSDSASVAGASETALVAASASVSALVPCKEEADDDDDTSARRANKGNGMNPLEVSRMLTMLKKRTKRKDCACVHMCNTHLTIVITIGTHVYVHMCITIWW